MKRGVLLIIAMLVPVGLACVVPEDGMVIQQSAELCNDVYFFDKGITINASDVNLDCNGAVFNAWNGKSGMTIQNASNVTVMGCRIVGYNIGLLVWKSSQVFLLDNHLVRNKVGANFLGVSGSAVRNHDVSLVRSFDVIDSSNNVFSLTNKRVEGSFCSYNFCNADVNSVERFMEPRISREEMQDWLGQQVTGKSRLTLQNWVFNFFTS